MAEASTVNITRLIDERPLGAMQIRVVVLCGFVALLDGLDLQAIGLAAPAIARALNVEPHAFGAVFGAALLGLMLGAFTLGPLADRIGRKRVLVASTCMFGFFTICTALAGSVTALLVIRFLTGLGLGGAMPSFISLGSEYAPRRIRSLLVTLLWAGFPLGGVIGGVLASFLIPAFGWQSVFYIGGIVPILLAAVLAAMLPESLGFLVANDAPPETIRRIVSRISPESGAGAAQRFVLGEEKLPGVPVRHLFSGGRAAGTLLLWVPYFTAFMMLVTNSSWSPIVLGQAGLGVSQSGLIMAMYNGGSVVGTLIVGWLINISGPYRVLTIALALSALAFGAVGFAAPSLDAVMALEGLGGLFLGAGSSGLIALAAVFYPISIRSSGVGWANGVGRFGSFCGPLIAASLVRGHWNIENLYLALGAPGLVAALFVMLLGLHQTMRGRRTPEEEPNGVLAPDDRAARP
jgi:AAHS family 4-hydroxybenzoate transporter-like MFS transporter